MIRTATLMTLQHVWKKLMSGWCTLIESFLLCFLHAPHLRRSECDLTAALEAVHSLM